jgi:hypothetical protein
MTTQELVQKMLSLPLLKIEAISTELNLFTRKNLEYDAPKLIKKICKQAVKLDVLQKLMRKVQEATEKK